MGMTIDKAIAKIWHCIVSIRDCVGNKEFVEALILSVEIMRKYQDIERIYQEWNEVNDCSYNQAIREIGEVIEDGNDKES